MTYFRLLAFFATVAWASESTGHSNSPCQYIQPNISAESGPLDFLILTAGFPETITFPEKGTTFSYEGINGCFSGSQRIDCHTTCFNTLGLGGQPLCWLKLKVPDVNGLNAIYITSKYQDFENVQGIYRPHGEYDKNDYFLESSRIVTCAKGQEVKLSWTPGNAKQSGPEVKCFYKGNTVQNGTFSSNHEISLHRGEERFEMATCAVQHKSVWIYSTRFVFWQDAVRFIPESKEMNNETTEVKNGTYALTWSVEMMDPSLDQPFRCVANSHPICSGLTLTEEPGKCQIEMNAHGFLFTYLWRTAGGRPEAFYCYLDNMVMAKSILNYGLDEHKALLETLIWQRLLKKYFSLDSSGSPHLKITGLHVDDISCERAIKEDEFLCKISPPNVRVLWIVKINEIDIVARVAQLNEPVYFNGSFTRCPGCDSRFTIINPQYNLKRPFQPSFKAGDLDVASIIRRILEEAFEDPTD